MNLPLVREKLKSTNTNELITALVFLKDNGELSDIQALMPLIKKNNPAISRAAINAVCSIIREKLLTNFNELVPEVRGKLGSLMETLDPAIVKELSKDIYGDNDSRRLRAVQILGLLKKNPQIRDLLAKLIKDRDEKIRATAVNLLGRVLGQNDQEIVLSLLKDRDKRVRANTIEAIENLGSRRLVPILLRFKKDTNNRIRGNALKALFYLGNTDIIDDLLDMLSSQDNYMIASALWVIAQTHISDIRLVDAAGYCLISENEMVLTNAKKTLLTLNTPRSLGFIHYLDNI